MFYSNEINAICHYKCLKLFNKIEMNGNLPRLPPKNVCTVRAVINASLPACARRSLHERGVVCLTRGRFVYVLFAPRIRVYFFNKLGGSFYTRM